MKQLLLPIPILALALSGCVSDPQVYALEKSSGDTDYRQRSDSALALLESMSLDTLVTRVLRVNTYLSKVQKDTVYVQEEIRPVMAMYRPSRVIRDTVYVHDTVYLK